MVNFMGVCSMKRIIGYVDGELEVERLETDSDDYYRGLFAGVESAIEENNQSSSYFGSIFSGIKSEDATPDYFKGYEAGYDLGISYVIEKRIKPCEEIKIKEDIDISKGLEYAKGYSDGYNYGYDIGYERGVEEVFNDEVVLESEFLDMVYALKEDVRRLALTGEAAEKLNFEELRKHNFAVYDCHHTLIGIVEWWAMDKVYKYWNKKEE